MTRRMSTAAGVLVLAVLAARVVVAPAHEVVDQPEFNPDLPEADQPGGVEEPARGDVRVARGGAG